jgi:hypothetical protein
MEFRKRNNMLAKTFEKEMSNLMKVVLENQPSKKKPNVSSSKISPFFYAKDPFKKDVGQQKQFLQGFGLLVVENQLPIQFVKSTWLKCITTHLHSKVVFLLKTKKFMKGFI